MSKSSVSGSIANRAHRGLGLVATLALVMPGWCLAQAASDIDARDPDARPRIGLVLGGGGARGAAHVGVLKVLEELRIPVDLVVGTSMGSIVGGLYATGMTPAEIEAEIRAMDWDGLFHDDPDRQDRSFRRKRDDDLYAFKAKIGYNKGKVEIPLAYIRGQKLDLVLNRLTLPVAGITDFDQLPIPYRAVATDIETGLEVILGKGNLSRSIRASMAVPAAYDPVEMDGMLLVDGGVANNVPVSVARDLGADIFIAVDVGSGLSSRDEINNALDITGQLANFLFSLNSRPQLASLRPEDVLIVPQLGDIDGGDFPRAGEAIDPGELAARAVIDQLRRYSLSEEEFSQHLAQRVGRHPGAPQIDYVRIENNSALGDEVIDRRITAKAGEVLDITKLEQDISTVYGLEVFESVRYNVVHEDDQTGLVIDATAKHWGPGFLQAGLTTSNSFEGDSTVRFGMVYTRTLLNKLNGEWRIGAQLGDDTGLFAEIYQPLDHQLKYFATGKILQSSNGVNLYDSDGNNLARYELDVHGIELATGRDFGTWGEGRLGYRRLTGDAKLRIGDPAPHLDIDRGEAYLRLSIDRLDDLYFPSSGYLGKVEYIHAQESLGSSVDYDQVLFAFTKAWTWGDNTLVGGFTGGTTSDDNAPVESLLRLGGLLRLSGLQEDQLSGQHAGLATLTYMRALKRASIFSSFLGVSLETGNVWQDSDDISFSNSINAGSVFLGMETPIGPVYIGYGRADTDESSLYLHIGPRFTF